MASAAKKARRASGRDSSSPSAPVRKPSPRPDSAPAPVPVHVDVAVAAAAAALAPPPSADESGEDDSLLRCLSDDCLLHVLRFLRTRFLLSSASLVCRRWRRLSSSHLVLELLPSPLSAYRLPWGSLLQEEVLELARRHASTLEKVTISGSRELNYEQIISFVRSCTQLRELALISCPAIESQPENVVDVLPCQLISFDVHKDHIFNGSCDEDTQIVSPPDLNVFIEKIQQKCPNLRHLNLDFASVISVECLDNLLLRTPKLCSIHLQSATIGWPEVSKILQSCLSLESISIISTSLIEEQTSDDEDDFFRNGAFRSRHRMASSKDYRHIELGSVAHKYLRSIRFYSSPHRSVPLDSTPLFGLLKDKGQQLRYLHAQSLYNTSWHTISVWCANLQILDLSHARTMQYSATGIEEVVLSGIPQLLKGLERLGLPSATDRVLVKLGRFCTKLKEIHFEGYSSTYGIIPSRTGVTDLGVVALAEGCPNLEVISLAGCISVTLSSLRALSFHCRNLKALLLPGCVKVNDVAIEAVWSRIGKRLIVLDLTGCKITSKTPRMLQQHSQLHGTSLAVLAVARSLHKSAKSDFSKLTAKFPFLRILSGTSGLPWDGFFHAYSLDEMVPYLRTTKEK